MDVCNAFSLYRFGQVPDYSSNSVWRAVDTFWGEGRSFLAAFDLVDDLHTGFVEEEVFRKVVAMLSQNVSDDVGDAFVCPRMLTDHQLDIVCERWHNSDFPGCIPYKALLSSFAVVDCALEPFSSQPHSVKTAPGVTLPQSSLGS